MKRSISSAASLAMAAAAAFALAGCGAGIYSQTAQKVPSVPGVNASTQGPGGNGSVGVRNATLAYPGVEGYQANEEATLQLWLFNDSTSEVTVTFTSDAGTVTTAAPVTVAAGSYANPEVKIRLSRAVGNAGAVPVTVAFSGAEPLRLEVPVATPTAPAPAATVHLEEGTGGGDH